MVSSKDIILVISVVILSSVLIQQLKPEVKEIVFEDQQIQTILEQYGQTNEEFAFCIHGTIDRDGVAFVKGVKPINPSSASQSSIRFKSCGMFKLLGNIHSHSEGNCRLSQTDKETLGKYNHVDGVVCGNSVDNFIFMNNELETVKYRVI